MTLNIDKSSLSQGTKRNSRLGFLGQHAHYHAMVEFKQELVFVRRQNVVELQQTAESAMSSLVRVCSINSIGYM